MPQFFLHVWGGHFARISTPICRSSEWKEIVSISERNSRLPLWMNLENLHTQHITKIDEPSEQSNVYDLILRSTETLLAFEHTTVLKPS